MLEKCAAETQYRVRLLGGTTPGAERRELCGVAGFLCLRVVLRSELRFELHHFLTLFPPFHLQPEMRLDFPSSP
jgi:hypothetical protein